LDDYLKNREEAESETMRDKVWHSFQSDLMTRLAPVHAVFIVATRWHEDDLGGRLLRKAPDEWHVLPMPALAEEGDILGRKLGDALWPGLWPAERLLREKKSRTPYWWAAMYQQQPGVYGEACWPDEYFEGIWADEAEWPEKFRASAIAIDPSKGKDTKKSDFTATVFVGVARGKLWVDARLKRLAPPQIVEEGLDWWAEKQPSYFGVEINAFQELLGNDFMRRAAERGYLSFEVTPIENYKPDKNTRIERLAKWLARGMVRIRPNPGGRELFRQLREFPHCNHDDGPDAMEMSFRLLDQAALAGAFGEDGELVTHGQFGYGG